MDKSKKKSSKVRKGLAIGLGTIIAAAGCLFAFLRTPSFRGEMEALSPEQKQLSLNLKEHVEVLAKKIGARNLPQAQGKLELAAMYIEDRLTKAGLTPERQSFGVSGYFDDGLWGFTHATQGTANIIAEIPAKEGSALASEILMVGAHYDTAKKSPGANDNASGVAALLEIAAALAKERFSRTVRFVAFSNEEPPFFRSNDMGSYRYAEACKQKGEKIVAMLSLETIGYYSDKPNSQQFPLSLLALFYPRTGNFLAFVGKQESSDLLRSCISSFMKAVKFPAEMLAAPESLEGIDFSDQVSFWRLGYPGIMVTDTAMYRYPHYHTAEDTAEKIDYDRLARVTSGLQAVVRDLAGK